MNTICGANCENCSFKSGCAGCEASCGRPFGGPCVAAEYIRLGGRENYAEFKRKLLDEVNALLGANGIPNASQLYELPGSYVNLPYPLPSGENVRFLDDTRVYLGAQIEVPGADVCFGVVADTTFILICSYGENGTNPELLAYRKR